MDEFHTLSSRPKLVGKLHDSQEILRHPSFLAIERKIALHLIEIHRKTPRLARLAASHRKWLLTQTLFAMHAGRDRSDPLSGLTASRLMQAAAEFDVASRNTAASFLSELVAYRFLRNVPDDTPDRRIRRLETTDASDEAMLSWFLGHMACLDELDGGNRAALTQTEPHLFTLAQPHAATALIRDPAWKHPRDSIGHFLWSDIGGLVLHDLVSRLPDDAREHDRVVLDGVSPTEIATEFGISLTNLKRMFKKAETDKLIGWEKARGRLWVSQVFIEDYFYWQAAKFAQLDQSIHWAAKQPPPSN